ncbi:DUF732 domain-containing protein [Mycolicibacterium aubagnense]|uniref:DUF732 domain-containing protein n=1 Tax=Mycolicibacterium aubagnense TaxID=319707 RepID=A0ABN5YXE1_9MYCO|nr:DUF732 domain-containing protein [Mycolicibacterium aubagnense]TLH49661.1 DUF732 domain-containing protein [Mycolicibacterium aubagnense]WGI32921.1 DUF732 domain-containing protein [Mycolicibacterium aubagnense]BBX85404.1 hypothetical protein MAUB_32770 [Mycolicibacterium aubagnense]
MTRHHRAVHALAAAGIGIAVAVSNSATAYADPDTDFANQLHTYGIYGPKDYNAWLGKIACQRLDNNIDHDAYQSATFVATNLSRQNATQQNWQFLSAAIDFYCPDKRSVLEEAAHQSQTGVRA